MPRVVGIDPGTISFDILGLQDGDAFLERSVPTSEVARHPETLLAVLQAALPLDSIAGPSGYGLPLVPIEAVGERYVERVRVGKLNVDDHPLTAARYGIRSIPTLLVFQGGQVVEQRVGALPQGEIELLLDRRLAESPVLR